MALNKGSMIAAGAAAEDGDTMLQGLVFDFEHYSLPDGTLLRKYVGCYYTSGDIEITEHAIVMQLGQFNALDVTGATA